jgi:hypothetical protein
MILLPPQIERGTKEKAPTLPQGPLDGGAVPVQAALTAARNRSISLRKESASLFSCVAAESTWVADWPVSLAASVTSPTLLETS